MLFASIISAHDCACVSRDASVTTGGRSANQRYMLNRRSAFSRPSAEMSPTTQLATLPLHVPSARLARSAFQRAHVASAVRAPAVPVVPAPPDSPRPAWPPPLPPIRPGCAGARSPHTGRARTGSPRTRGARADGAGAGSPCPVARRPTVRPAHLAGRARRQQQGHPRDGGSSRHGNAPMNDIDRSGANPLNKGHQPQGCTGRSRAKRGRATT